jgi:hypothetical protein
MSFKFIYSLFLAGKVEETPKKCKDIIKVAKASLSEAQFQQFGEDAKVISQISISISNYIFCIL